MIGGGIVGLSTAYALSEQGVGVRLYEAGLPGDGQCAGESRFFRHAHDDSRLVAFARESRGVCAGLTLVCLLQTSWELWRHPKIGPVDSS